MRSQDAGLHNRILNDPAITGHFGAQFKDLTPLFNEPGAYVLLDNGADAASVLEWSAPGVWQCHTYFLPSCRGKRAIEAGKGFLRWMFEREGARMVWGQTPVGNRQAIMFNRLCGAVSDGFDDHPYSGRIEYFIVERDAWLHRQ